MKVRLKAVWLGAVLGLLVVYFWIVITFRDSVGWGMLAVIFICVFIGALIAFPVAEAISQKSLDKLFGVNKGKVPKDYSKARRLLAEERFEEAVAEFRNAVEEEPEEVTLRVEIAEIYGRELHDYRRAIEEYASVLAMNMGDSERASILNRIADMYESGLKDEQMAIRTLSRIIETLPGTKFAEQARQRIAGVGQKARPT